MIHSFFQTKDPATKETKQEFSYEGDSISQFDSNVARATESYVSTLKTKPGFFSSLDEIDLLEQYRLWKDGVVQYEEDVHDAIQKVDIAVDSICVAFQELSEIQAGDYNADLSIMKLVIETQVKQIAIAINKCLCLGIHVKEHNVSDSKMLDVKWNDSNLTTPDSWYILKYLELVWEDQKMWETLCRGIDEKVRVSGGEENKEKYKDGQITKEKSNISQKEYEELEDTREREHVQKETIGKCDQEVGVHFLCNAINLGVIVTCVTSIIHDTFPIQLEEFYPPQVEKCIMNKKTHYSTLIVALLSLPDIKEKEKQLFSSLTQDFDNQENESEDGKSEDNYDESDGSDGSEESEESEGSEGSEENQKEARNICQGKSIKTSKETKEDKRETKYSVNNTFSLKSESTIQMMNPWEHDNEGSMSTTIN